jgi:hypothetical protein
MHLQMVRVVMIQQQPSHLQARLHMSRQPLFLMPAAAVLAVIMCGVC